MWRQRRETSWKRSNGDDCGADGMTMAGRSQFRSLTRHFFDRLFDRDSTSPGSEPHANVIQAVGLLAVPGLMLTFWAGESVYFHVQYSMLVTGIVSIAKWDSLFPDKRDYLILTSLPIRYRSFFLAKVSALCLFLLIFAISTNFFATLMIPLARGGPSFLTNLTAHVAGVFGGALFMALGFAALQGVLINLPRGMFRRMSPVIQMVSLTVLLTLFLIYPLIGAALPVLVERSSALLHYFPIFWFVGLYRSLLANGSPSPAVDALGTEAIYGLLSAGALFVATYAAAYRRHARSVLDGVEFEPIGADSKWRNGMARRFDSVWLRHPTHRACFRFIGATLTRSSRHQVFLAIYLAIGLSLGLSTLCSVDRTASFPFKILPDGMLALPLILSFFVISGLRATFNIPHELPANWLFQLTDTGNSREYVAATQKFVKACGVPPFLLFTAIMEFAYWPWAAAAFHLLFETVVSLLLVQVFFSDFRKVPFTCSYFPGKKNLALLAGFYLYGFTTYSSTMVALEKFLMESPVRIIPFAIAGITVITALSMRRRRTPKLIYEERSDTELQGLGLH
jgi:hypothetical protein